MSTRPLDASAINFSWLIRLRWGAIAGQVVTILAVSRWMGADLPLGPMFAIVALELVTNIASVTLAHSHRPVHEWWSGAVMALDTILLTGLLFYSGGPFNPFSFLYLVQISLAAVILPARWTWALAGLALVGSGFLFLKNRPLSFEGMGHAEHMSVHLRGMWIAFGVAAIFIVYFLLRVRRALAERELDLTAAQNLALRQEKLASLATLAAGAAHELSTPLSTIAIVAKELERQVSGSAGILDDVRLIRSEVDRCRTILEHMATEAGASTGESPKAIDVRGLIDVSLKTIRERPGVRVEVDGASACTVMVPERAVSQAIASLIKNAQDASESEVEVIASADARNARIEVRDRGQGMSDEILKRIGEPFFTTKPAGRGMGLGLFLARTVLERVGGELKFSSTPGQGTVATVTLPRIK